MEDPHFSTSATPPTVITQGAQEPAKVALIDFHDVVVKTNKDEARADAFNLLKKIYREQGIVRAVMVSLAVSWHMFYDTKVLHKKEEELSFVGWAVKHYPWVEKYAEEALAIRNNYTPREDTLELIRNLKNDGYTVVLATNLHQDYAKSLEERYENLMHYFDVRFYASPQNSAKPQQKYFEQLVKKLEEEKNIDRENAHFIFTDNSKKNVAAAKKALRKEDNTPLIESILFENAHQVAVELQARKLLKKQKED